MGDQNERERYQDRVEKNDYKQHGDCHRDLHQVKQKIIPVENRQGDRVRRVVNVLVSPGHVSRSVRRERIRDPRQSRRRSGYRQDIRHENRFFAIAPKYRAVFGTFSARREIRSGQARQVPDFVRVVHDRRQFEHGRNAMRVRERHGEYGQVVHAVLQLGAENEPQQTIRQHALHGDREQNAGETVGVAVENFRTARIQQSENP